MLMSYSFTMLFCIVLTFIMAPHTLLNAQYPDVHYGIKAGIHTSTIVGDDFALDHGVGNLRLSAPQSRLGFRGGAFVGVRASRTFIAQIEALYSTRGAKYSGLTTLINNSDTSMPNLDATLELAYLEIPILASYVFETYSETRYTLFIGPTPAFLLNNKITGELNNETSTDPTTLDSDLTELPTFELDAAIGAAIAFPLSSAKLLVEIRYTLALTKLNQSEDLLDSRNAVLSFQTGLEF